MEQLKKKCKLKRPNDPDDCSGPVAERWVSENQVIDCCETHFIAYKQILFLANSGVSSVELGRSTMASRILLINKIKENK